MSAAARVAMAVHAQARPASELAAQIAATMRALDERDREDQTRLRNLRAKSARRPA